MTSARNVADTALSLALTMVWFRSGAIDTQATVADDDVAGRDFAFVEMAHRIVWCTVATVGADGAQYPGPAPGSGSGTATSHRLDRHVSQLAQGPGPGRPSQDLADLLVATHDTCTADAHEWDDTEGEAGVAPPRRGPRPGGLRPVDHPDGTLDHRRVQHPAPPPAPAAGDGRLRHDPARASVRLTWGAQGGAPGARPGRRGSDPAPAGHASRGADHAWPPATGDHIRRGRRAWMGRRVGGEPPNKQHRTLPSSHQGVVRTPEPGAMDGGWC